MAKVSITAKLKALQKKWKAAVPKTGGSLQNGDYEGVIKAAIIKECKDGELQAVWELEVTAPENFAGRTQTKFDYLGNEQSFDYLQGSFLNLGIEPPETTTEIPSCLGQAEGLPVAFRVVNKQENTNVYFIGILEGVEVEATEDEVDASDEEELTAEEVADMGDNDDEDGLQAIIDDYELEIDQDEYETYAEVAELIIEGLEL